MKNLSLLLYVLLLLSFNTEAEIKVSPWQIHEGNEGIITFKISGHGDPEAYTKMQIPPADDANWKVAPKEGDVVSVNRGSSLTCLEQLDFLYFQTEVFIPKNTTIDQFTISYDKADDGARIYFFNSRYPQGLFNEKADLKIGHESPGSVNLSNQVVAGESNRVVIVQFDDCADKNTLSGIHIKVNGEEVKESKGAIMDLCGNNYNTKKYGNHFWLQENLKAPACSACPEVKHVELGEHPSKNGHFYVHNKPMYAFYKNNKDDKDPVTGKPLGALFNFAAIQSCNVCPDGYRLPTKEDWETLVASAGGTQGLTKRIESNDNKPFAYLSGRADAYGSVMRGRFVEFWTSEEVNENQAISTLLHNNGTNSFNREDKRVGAYVRCIQGTTPVVPAHFKLKTYSTNGNQDEPDHWMGWETKNDSDWAKILIVADTADFQHMKIKRVEANGVPEAIYLKVENYDTPDSYLTVDPDDGNKIKIKQGKSENAQFRVKAPLQTETPNSNYVSFESVTKPNFYMRHRGYKLYADEATSAKLNKKIFIEDASWLFQKNR